MKKQLVRIGFLNKDKKFVSVWSLYRVIRKNTVRYNNITYSLFDEDWNCFIL